MDRHRGQVLEHVTRQERVNLRHFSDCAPRSHRVTPFCTRLNLPQAWPTHSAPSSFKLQASIPVGSASIILGKVDSGRFFYFFLTRSEHFIEFSSPLELIKSNCYVIRALISLRSKSDMICQPHASRASEDTVSVKLTIYLCTLMH